MKRKYFSLGLVVVSCISFGMPTATAAPYSASTQSDLDGVSLTQNAQPPAVVTAEDRETIEKNSQPTVEEKTDQLIVKFKDSTAENEKADVLEELSQQSEVSEEAEIVKETVDDASVVSAGTLLDTQAQQEAVAQLEANPAVEYAEPDYIISGSMAANPGNPPNDPYYSGYQWNLRAIDAAGAWNYATGQGVLIGIADTGQTYHPDLDGKYKQGYDFISATDYSRDGDGRDWNPNDEGDWGPNYSATSTWHGTHVAGIAAAKTGNGVGVAGVAPDAQLQAARIMGKDGTAYISDQAAGIAWSAGVPVSGVPNNPTPVDVVNYSEGIILPDHKCPQVLQGAIDSAHARNVPVVVSAGNNGIDAKSVTPANCLGAIVVGSTTINNTMVGYSNWGSMLDVLAPGGNASNPIWSTKNSGTYGQGTPNYGTLHGTSMAAPHVAGIVAMMKERNPKLGVEEIRSILKNTGSSVNGYQMVNARRAVSSVADTRKPKLVGAIGQYYRSHGESAVFGEPKANEFATADGGFAQEFTKGYTIYWTEKTGAHAVKFSGAIGALYSANKWENGYGYPTEDETAYSYGARQTFQKKGLQTRIYWSENTGAHALKGYGAIFAKWVELGHATTVGFPATEEVSEASGSWQKFRTRAGAETLIYWSAVHGAHSLNAGGALYHYWRNNGYTSTFGVPVTDETAHEDGSYSVRFSSGAELRWSPTEGVKVLGFTDTAGNPFEKEISWLSSSGISTGWADGTFRPYTGVSRDQMAAFFYRMAGSPDYTAPSVSPFKDVPTNSVFYKEIAWMQSQGIAQGWADGTFRPHTAVTRDQMAAFFYRMADSPAYIAPKTSPFKDVYNNQVFYKEISWMKQTGISTGWSDGSYRPYQPVNRDQMAAFIYRFSHR